MKERCRSVGGGVKVKYFHSLACEGVKNDYPGMTGQTGRVDQSDRSPPGSQEIKSERVFLRRIFR